MTTFSFFFFFFSSFVVFYSLIVVFFVYRYDSYEYFRNVSNVIRWGRDDEGVMKKRWKTREDKKELHCRGVLYIKTGMTGGKIHVWMRLLDIAHRRRWNPTTRCGNLRIQFANDVTPHVHPPPRLTVAVVRPPVMWGRGVRGETSELHLNLSPPKPVPLRRLHHSALSRPRGRTRWIVGFQCMKIDIDPKTFTHVAWYNIIYTWTLVMGQVFENPKYPAPTYILYWTTNCYGWRTSNDKNKYDPM